MQFCQDHEKAILSIRPDSEGLVSILHDILRMFREKMMLTGTADTPQASKHLAILTKGIVNLAVLSLINGVNNMYEMPLWNEILLLKKDGLFKFCSVDHLILNVHIVYIFF